MGNNNFLKIGAILAWIAMKQSSLYKIMMFLLFCLSISTNTQAQIYATCTHRDYYKWNDTTKEFEYLNGYDENSMFKINKKLTMFEHTTPDMSSSYYISESEYNEEEEILSLVVVSDVGNDYIYVFDISNDTIRVIFKQDEVLQLLVFNVKKFWSGNE